MGPFSACLLWIAHSTALAAVAIVLPRLTRLRSPRWMAAWWGVAAVASVLLPVVLAALPDREAGSAGAVAVTMAVRTTATAIAPALDAPTLLAGVWLALAWAVGCLIRLGWLAVGRERLRRLARSGERVEDDPAIHAAARLAGVRVPVIAVRRVSPCAFGWRHVRVLVPESLSEQPYAERRCVYLHEFLHVARGDVRRAYGEEAWRVLWWWQPAVWWTLSRLRLAREHQVDRAVLRHTGEPRAYVEALVWCSGLGPALDPSASVSRRRHELVQRVALMIDKEVEMTRMRGAVLTVAMVLLLGTSAATLATVTPLHLAQLAGDAAGFDSMPGPLERMAIKPSLDVPAPRRTLAIGPAWPAGVPELRFRVHLVLDAGGHVAEARLVTMQAGPTPRAGFEAEVANARAAVLDAVKQWQFDPPLQAPMLLVTDVSSGAGEPRTAAATSPRQPIRAGGNIPPPRKVYEVKPIYPAEAMDAKVQGVVVVDCTIATDGSVSDARVVQSVPMLDDAALAAVRQWRFTPTLLNGEPVPIEVTLTINFTLK